VISLLKNASLKSFVPPVHIFSYQKISKLLSTSRVSYAFGTPCDFQFVTSLLMSEFWRVCRHNPLIQWRDLGLFLTMRHRSIKSKIIQSRDVQSTWLHMRRNGETEWEAAVSFWGRLLEAVNINCPNKSIRYWLTGHRFKGDSMALLTHSKNRDKLNWN
jgi:hypothetical protein